VTFFVQIVSLWVPLCCNKCESDVKKHLQGVDGNIIESLLKHFKDLSNIRYSKKVQVHFVILHLLRA
jgi:copper chaperone CopZ